MIKYIQILCLLCCSCYSSAVVAQKVFKVHAEESSSFNDQQWSEWMPASDLFVFQTTELTQYGKQISFSYHFLTPISEKNSIQSQSLTTEAIDADGDSCKIRFLYQKDDQYYQIYLDYPDISYVYNVKAAHQLYKDHEENYPILQSFIRTGEEWEDEQPPAQTLKISERHICIIGQKEHRDYDLVYDYEQTNSSRALLRQSYAIDDYGKKCFLIIEYNGLNKSYNVIIDYPEVSYNYKTTGNSL